MASWDTESHGAQGTIGCPRALDSPVGLFSGSQALTIFVNIRFALETKLPQSASVYVTGHDVQDTPDKGVTYQKEHGVIPQSLNGCPATLDHSTGESAPHLQFPYLS